MKNPATKDGLAQQFRRQMSGALAAEGAAVDKPGPYPSARAVATRGRNYSCGVPLFAASTALPSLK